uniref:Uncharacterized protein n=1 Tax=Romanomermis culicivorax TaxID=13658 RepID=A0A915I1Q6_ROMCU
MENDAKTPQFFASIFVVRKCQTGRFVRRRRWQRYDVAAAVFERKKLFISSSDDEEAYEEMNNKISKKYILLTQQKQLDLISSSPNIKKCVSHRRNNFDDDNLPKTVRARKNARGRRRRRTRIKPKPIFPVVAVVDERQQPTPKNRRRSISNWKVRDGPGSSLDGRREIFRFWQLLTVDSPAFCDVKFLMREFFDDGGDSTTTAAETARVIGKAFGSIRSTPLKFSFELAFFVIKNYFLDQRVLGADQGSFILAIFDRTERNGSPTA